MPGKKLHFADITHSKDLMSRAIFNFQRVEVYLDISSFLTGLTHMEGEQAIYYSKLTISILNEDLFGDHFYLTVYTGSSQLRTPGPLEKSWIL